MTRSKSKIELRDFRAADAAQVNRLALAAFDQFKSHYSDWPAMSGAVGRMATLAENAEIILAELADKIIGAVAYVPPGRPKPPFFEIEWPVIRMLVVDPDHRRLGAGQTLTEECLKRACRDGSAVIALHTSPIMTVALSMYIRMGFELVRETPAIFGVPYAVYIKHLSR
jgi:ribosomal protein S18 acetylase RimI-like enzyme